MIAGLFNIRKAELISLAPLERSRLIRRISKPSRDRFHNERLMRVVSIGIALIGLAFGAALLFEYLR